MSSNLRLPKFRNGYQVTRFESSRFESYLLFLHSHQLKIQFVVAFLSVQQWKNHPSSAKLFLRDWFLPNAVLVMLPRLKANIAHLTRSNGHHGRHNRRIVIKKRTGNILHTK